MIGKDTDAEARKFLLRAVQRAQEQAKFWEDLAIEAQKREDTATKDREVAEGKVDRYVKALAEWQERWRTLDDIKANGNFGTVVGWCGFTMGEPNCCTYHDRTAVGAPYA